MGTEPVKETVKEPMKGMVLPGIFSGKKFTYVKETSQESVEESIQESVEKCLQSTKKINSTDDSEHNKDDQDDLEESDMSGPIDFTNLKGLSVKIKDGGTRAVSNDNNEDQSKTLPDEKENNQNTPPDDDYSDYVPVTESPESPDNDVEMPQENGKENGEKNGEKS